MLTLSVLQHIAGLSALSFSEEELRSVQKEAEAFLGFIRETAVVCEECTKPSDQSAPLREDAVRPSLTAKEATEAMPFSDERGYALLPGRDLT